MMSLVSPPHGFTLSYWVEVVAQLCIKIGFTLSRLKCCIFSEDMEEFMDIKVVCKP